MDCLVAFAPRNDKKVIIAPKTDNCDLTPDARPSTRPLPGRGGDQGEGRSATRRRASHRDLPSLPIESRRRIFFGQLAQGILSASTAAFREVSPRWLGKREIPARANLLISDIVR